MSTLMTHVDNVARNTIGLCEELLMVMKAESQPLALAMVDLCEVVQQAIDEVALQAQARHILLQQAQARPGAVMIRGDAAQIRRALINLMNNAIKFSPAESVVRVDIACDGALAKVAIADLGPGIPSSDLGKLFRRYQRLEVGQHLLGVLEADTSVLDRLAGRTASNKVSKTNGSLGYTDNALGQLDALVGNPADDAGWLYGLGC